MSRNKQARWLALTVASGPWSADALQVRLGRILPFEDPELNRLVARFLATFDKPGPSDVEDIAAFALTEPMLQLVLKHETVRAPVLEAPEMRAPPPSLAPCPVPEITTVHDLADWLDIGDDDLSWLADVRDRQWKETSPKLHHYRYAGIEKRCGETRLIEIPKSRLKAIQRKIQQRILSCVLPHESAHGFRRHRSVKSFATPHVANDVLLRLDLKDFFLQVSSARVFGIFTLLGYPKEVARLLTHLCTNAVAPKIAGQAFTSVCPAQQQRLGRRHLPQGAPTSPALANLCAWRLDQRLAGLARAQKLTFTRYADDLVFSGDWRLSRRADFLEVLIGSIAIEEGLPLNHRKTRLKTSSQRQRIAGVVVNTKTNTARSDFDALKAVLFNCARYGPASQNRERLEDYRSHLKGRIAHHAWLNPGRGKKLLRLWERIDWNSS